jgi:hypothetical protein
MQPTPVAPLAAPADDAGRQCAAAVLVLEAQAARCAGLRRQLRAAMDAKAARGEDVEEQIAEHDGLLQQELRADRERMQLIMAARRTTLREIKFN